MLVTIANCEHQDAPTRLRGPVQRRVVDIVFDAVMESPRTRRLEAFHQVSECTSVCMADQVRDVFYEYDSRPQASDIGWNGFQDLVVMIGHVVFPIDQLAKAFARRAGSKKI
jgi:hypothetical protein